MTATLTLYNPAIATLKCAMRLKIIGIDFSFKQNKIKIN